jgi:hypothetical protein
MAKKRKSTVNVVVLLSPREHPWRTGILVLCAVIGAIAAAPTILDWFNSPRGDRLSLFFSEWSRPFSCNALISPPRPIRAGVHTTFRFAIRDGNKRHPLVREVFLILPSDAKVIPGEDSGRTWRQANSLDPATIQYFCTLNYRVPVGEHAQFLPPLDISFLTAGANRLGYIITGEDIDKRKECISTIQVEG